MTPHDHVVTVGTATTSTCVLGTLYIDVTQHTLLTPLNPLTPPPHKVNITVSSYQEIMVIRYTLSTAAPLPDPAMAEPVPSSTQVMCVEAVSAPKRLTLKAFSFLLPSVLSSISN